MSSNQDPQDSGYPKRRFSLEEKRNYCIAWKKSGMSQIAFCKAYGVSKSALHSWYKEFNQEDKGSGFSPLVSEQSPLKRAEMAQLTIGFPNQMQLSITLPEQRLVSFIQELSCATAIIR